MNTRRKLIFSFGSAAVAAPLTALAQNADKVWRVGFLYNGSHQSAIDTGRYPAFLEGLRQLGYVDGKNIVIDAKFTNTNDQLMALSAEILKGKPDLVVSSGVTGTHALLSMKTNTPIVIVVAFDAVREGLATSLSRPSGSVTGLSALLDEIFVKHIELLKLAVPKLSRIAVLSLPGDPDHLAVLKALEASARQQGIQINRVDVDVKAGFEPAFLNMANKQINAMIVQGSAYFVQHFREIAALAVKNKIASTYSGREYPEVGGLMSYGPNFSDNYRRAASYVDKILKGAKSGDLPMEQPTHFYLTINRKTAQALGISLSQELLLRADKVIE